MFNSELSVCQSVFLWIILSQQVKQKVSEPSVESDRSLTWWRQTGEDGGRVGGETGWDRHAGGAVLKFKLIDFIYLFIY